MVAQEANFVPNRWPADQPVIMAVWLAFRPYLRASDLEPSAIDLLAVRVASRVVDLKLGMSGPRLPGYECRQCWGEHYVWLGASWGRRHVKPSHAQCSHECHAAEHFAALGEDDGDLEPLPEPGTQWPPFLP